MTRSSRPGAASSRRKSKISIRSIRGIDDLRRSILRHAQRDFGVENQGEFINAAIDALMAFLAHERLLEPKLNAAIMSAQQRGALEHQWLADEMRRNHSFDEDDYHGAVDPLELAEYRKAIEDGRNTPNEPPTEDRLAFERRLAERRARRATIMQGGWQ